MDESKMVPVTDPEELRKLARKTYWVSINEDDVATVRRALATQGVGAGAEFLANLDSAIAEMQAPDRAVLLDAAAAEYSFVHHSADHGIEIDDDAAISRDDEGNCYVQAWLWVRGEDAEEGEE